MHGVSINAVVGDNGIITQAQSATYATSRAVLEEFLQTYYFEHYDELGDEENKAQALYSYSGSSSWFYKTDLGYVVDSEGYIHWFIIPENLPDDVSSQITGGSGTGKSYSDYIKCNDVYGVTSDLKVYYCAGGLDTITGIASSELDSDSATREIFSAGSAYANLLNSGNAITAQTVKGIKTLTIDSTSGITDLSEIYKLISLETLNISDISISLSGIENLAKLKNVTITNCTITNASGISRSKHTAKIVFNK